MPPKTKKLIVREGLIFVAAYFTAMFSGDRFAGTIIFYVIFHFVVWTIRALRRNKEKR